MNVLNYEDLNSVNICGYAASDLVALAYMIKQKDIEPEMLRDSVEMYLKGYKDGQAITQSNIEKTVNGYKQSFNIGDFGRSLMFAPELPRSD